MKNIPILFSTPMVQAILNGTKSQTRRIIKPQPIDNREVDGNFFEGGYKGYVKVDGHPNWKDQFVFEFAKWQPGDVLWVRETFVSGYLMEDGDFVKDETQNPISHIWFKADHDLDQWYDGTSDFPSDNIPWKPSIHMPKSACRIFLKVKEVRCEQLHDINRGDAMKEGCPFPNMSTGEDPRDWFTNLWRDINGAESWEANPWVWVIEFERCEMPEGFLTSEVV